MWKFFTEILFSIAATQFYPLVLNDDNQTRSQSFL